MEAERCRLTVEMWVKFDPEGLSDPPPQAKKGVRNVEVRNMLDRGGAVMNVFLDNMPFPSLLFQILGPQLGPLGHILLQRVTGAPNGAAPRAGE